MYDFLHSVDKALCLVIQVLGTVSTDEVKEGEMGRVCSTYEEKRNAYRILVGNPERKRPLGRPGRKWGIILKWIFEK
jgi:hypothetical protein